MDGAVIDERMDPCVVNRRFRFDSGGNVPVSVCAAVRYSAEPFASGIAFGPLIRRLVDGRPLEPESMEDHSTANRQLRRRLRRNEWALHNQVKIVAWVFSVAVVSRLVIFASALWAAGWVAT